MLAATRNFSLSNTSKTVLGARPGTFAVRAVVLSRVQRGWDMMFNPTLPANVEAYCQHRHTSAPPYTFMVWALEWVRF